ncbi:hypothetical protein DPEC_G00267040 [Dallia pectoralis]|uniref:Uncharacterized protein n=1 Tax=Dallia pectoralis TaxID=75939 RepID=A0ACC2FNH6_DALPE|nr:hypothetical protein DPEC_G00267040 [Dallia pectoralis]
MNWDNQLSSILSAADGSVAKMRERLTSPGKYPKVDLYPMREVAGVSDLEPPRLPPLTHLAGSLIPPPSSSTAVQWADLAAVQSQLQIQSQAIESLTRSLYDMDRERHSHQRHIEALQVEVRRLREQSLERERNEEQKGLGTASPGAERRLEQWRREVSHELSSLRGHVTRATSLGNLEESFSSKLRREELDHLRREIDKLKSQFRRQEEDIFLQQSEAKETRRQYERSSKILEELTESYRNNSFDLAKTVSKYTHTEQEVRQIRTTVSELKDEISSFILRERQHTPTVKTRAAELAAISLRREVKGQREKPESDSDDFSPTPSLAEISSDDLSWLDDRDSVPHPAVSRVRQSTRPRGNHLKEQGSGLDDDDNDLDEDNLGSVSDKTSDLSLNDL